MAPEHEYEKCIPPGLILPGPEEPTEPYLVENFNHSNHDYDDIKRYGAFMVALLALNAQNSGRVSLMPTYKDTDALYKAGYGMTGAYFQRYYGGTAALQAALHFCPDSYRPSRPELIERFQWMARHALDLTKDLEGRPTLQNIFQWGQKRDLLPSSLIIMSALEDDTTEVQKIFSLERPNARRQLTYLDVYRFGARVIRENGAPLERAAMNRQYKGVFAESAASVIRAFFEHTHEFWLEFGFVDNAKGMSPQDLVNIGVRRAIADNDPVFTTGRIRQLSHDKVFPSLYPVRNNEFRGINGISGYQRAVLSDYAFYQRLRSRYIEQGAYPEVFQAVCQKFVASPEFESWLFENRTVILALSSASAPAEYILWLMQHGFDLENEVVFRAQHKILLKSLEQLRLRTYSDRAFVFEVIPRLNADEMLDK